jgi:hypothetical protein
VVKNWKVGGTRAFNLARCSWREFVSASPVLVKHNEWSDQDNDCFNWVIIEPIEIFRKRAGRDKLRRYRKKGSLEEEWLP